jgi:hypothetical protein
MHQPLRHEVRKALIWKQEGIVLIEALDSLPTSPSDKGNMELRTL